MRVWALGSMSLALAFGSGCAAHAHGTYERTFSGDDFRLGQYASAFRASERSLLEDLAHSDARLMSRVSPKPTAEELKDPDRTLAGDRAEWLSLPFVDPFAATDREMALEDATSTLASTALPDDARFGPKALAASSDLDASIRWLAIDQELLRRLLAEEKARLESERTLPRGAIELLPALVVAWPLRHSTAELDATVAWRLSDVRKSLAPGVFSASERDAMRISLVALAAKAPRGSKTRSELAQLDDVLARTWTAPYSTVEEASFEGELRTFVDADASLDAVPPTLERVTEMLAGQIDAAFGVLDATHRASVLARAKVMLLSPKACAVRWPARTARDLAPPAERALACSLVRGMSDAATDEDEIASLVALHDAAVLGAWAVAFHGKVREPKAAWDRYVPLVSLTTEERARVTREASVRPAGFVAAALAADVLFARGGGGVKRRAAAWRAFGEAPLDIVRLVLAGK